MITIGESIRQIWVNTEFEAETMKGQSSMPLGVHYPEMTEMYRHDKSMHMKMTQNSNMTTNCVHHAEMDIQKVPLSNDTRCEKSGLCSFRLAPTQNRPVQPQKRANSLKFRIYIEERVANTKALNSCAGTSRLICVFVFAIIPFFSRRDLKMTQHNT